MKYTVSHEWILVEKDIGTVGISNHAQQELGEVVYIELPILGKKILAGEEVAVLESTKAAADIYSPVSGEIISINDVLIGDVSLLNKSPEKEGWLYKIRLSDPAELNALMDSSVYFALVKP